MSDKIYLAHTLQPAFTQDGNLFHEMQYVEIGNTFDEAAEFAKEHLREGEKIYEAVQIGEAVCEINWNKKEGK